MMLIESYISEGEVSLEVDRRAWCCCTDSEI